MPSPGAVCTSARPPWRAIRPMIDSRTPTRPGSTASSVEALAAVADVGRDPVRLDLDVDGSPRARRRGGRRCGPPRARRPRARRAAASIVAVADEHEVDLDVVAVLDVGDDALEGGAQRGDRRRRRRAAARRTARRAARAPGGGPGCGPGPGASARWMSASVCSTESCRWAAISERSSERMRSRRSSPRSRHSRTIHGPEQERDTDAGGEHDQAEAADGRQHAARREQHARARRRGARRRRRPASSRPRVRSSSSVRAHTSPKPIGGEHHRPHDARREHQAGAAEQEHGAEGEEAEADGPLGGRRTARRAAARPGPRRGGAPSRPGRGPRRRRWRR